MCSLCSSEHSHDCSGALSHSRRLCIQHLVAKVVIRLVQFFSKTIYRIKSTYPGRKDFPSAGSRGGRDQTLQRTYERRGDIKPTIHENRFIQTEQFGIAGEVGEGHMFSSPQLKEESSKCSNYRSGAALPHSRKLCAKQSLLLEQSIQRDPNILALQFPLAPASAASTCSVGLNTDQKPSFCYGLCASKVNSLSRIYTAHAPALPPATSK